MVKKLLSIFLIFTLCLTVFTGCGNDSPQSSSEDPTVTSEEDPKNVKAEEYSAYLDERGYIKDLTALNYVKAPDLSQLTIKKSEVTPSQDEIMQSIDQLLSLTKEKDSTATVKNGDLVNFDYVGKIDGVAFEGGSQEGAELTAGGTQFIDNFLTKIIGHKSGETFDIECTFPEDYGKEELNGKTATFTVTINFVYVVPELTDEWCKSHQTEISYYAGFSNIQTAEDLKTAFSDYFYNYKLEEKIYGYLSELKPEDPNFKLPEEAYQYQYNYMDTRLRAQYGVTFADAIKEATYTEEEARSLVEADAMTELYFQAFCEDQKITVQKEDISEVTKTDDNEEFIAKFGLPYVLHMVLMHRALDGLKANVQIVTE